MVPSSQQSWSKAGVNRARSPDVRISELTIGRWCCWWKLARSGFIQDNIKQWESGRVPSSQRSWSKTGVSFRTSTSSRSGSPNLHSKVTRRAPRLKRATWPKPEREIGCLLETKGSSCKESRPNIHLATSDPGNVAKAKKVLLGLCADAKQQQEVHKEVECQDRVSGEAATKSSIKFVVRLHCHQ